MIITGEGDFIFTIFFANRIRNRIFKLIFLLQESPNLCEIIASGASSGQHET